jgi:hypothetical protein
MSSERVCYLVGVPKLRQKKLQEEGVGDPNKHPKTVIIVQEIKTKKKNGKWI